MKLLGIETSPEEFDALMVEQNNGKKLKVVDKKVVAVVDEPTEEDKILLQILELKKILSKNKEDVEQVSLFGIEREDFNDKKEECKQIILKLKELEEKLNKKG